MANICTEMDSTTTTSYTQKYLLFNTFDKKYKYFYVYYWEVAIFRPLRSDDDAYVMLINTDLMTLLKRRMIDDFRYQMDLQN